MDWEHSVLKALKAEIATQILLQIRLEVMVARSEWWPGVDGGQWKQREGQQRKKLIRYSLLGPNQRGKETTAPWGRVSLLPARAPSGREPSGGGKGKCDLGLFWV